MFIHEEPFHRYAGNQLHVFQLATPYQNSKRSEDVRRSKSSGRANGKRHELANSRQCVGDNVRKNRLSRIYPKHPENAPNRCRYSVGDWRFAFETRAEFCRRKLRVLNGCEFIRERILISRLHLDHLADKVRHISGRSIIWVHRVRR
jgi:hypothetical protein